MKQKQETQTLDKPFIEINHTSYGQFFENGDFLVFFYLQMKSGFMLNYTQVMMISDTISSRYLSSLTVELYEKLSWEFMPTVDSLLLIYNWDDNLLKLRGNESYKIIKCFESICTGVIIRDNDKLRH